MRSQTAILFAALALGCVASRAVAADETDDKSAAVARQIPALIRDLDNDDFAARQRATRELGKLGHPAIEPLTEAAQIGSLEVVTRVVSILERMYVHGDDDVADAVELALEHLGRSENQSIAGRAGTVLARNYVIRDRRAIAEIRRAGGVFKKGQSDENFVPTDPRQISYRDLILHIGRGWTAGDAGLEHVKRLSRLKHLRLVTGVNGVTKAGLENLSAALPTLLIHERGSAKLGLSGSPSAPRCEIANVAPGSAAFEAKLQRGDVIVRFDGRPVSDFDALVESIKLKKPGDTVELDVQKGGRGTPKKVSVVLKGWEQP